MELAPNKNVNKLVDRQEFWWLWETLNPCSSDYTWFNIYIYRQEVIWQTHSNWAGRAAFWSVGAAVESDTTLINSLIIHVLCQLARFMLSN